MVASYRDNAVSFRPADSFHGRECRGTFYICPFLRAYWLIIEILSNLFSNFHRKMKRFFKNFTILTIPIVFVCFLFLELFFRFVIPATDPPQAYFEEENLMYKFSIDKKEGLFTIGRFAQQRAKWRINNYGWNSPIDYKKKKEKKRIAIIGDSYIEAFQVDLEKSYPSLLRKKIGDDYDVYSFGKSGAPLSQYLHISRYVKRIFNPDIIIFNIVHNDFDENILKLNPNDTHFLTLNVRDKLITENSPRPNYSFSQFDFKKRWIKKSALVRYILFNLHAKEKIINIFSRKTNYNANVEINKIQNNYRVIWLATEYIMSQIKRENQRKRVIFVMDAPRNDIYQNNLERSNVFFLNEMMDKLCKNNGFEFLDLTEPMRIDYELYHIKFNSEFDGHWNVYGHAFVCEKVLNQLKLNKPLN